MKDFKLKNALDAIPVSVLILDKNALISFVNKAAHHIINKNEDEVICKHFGDSFCCTVSYKDERGLSWYNRVVTAYPNIV